MKKKSMVIRRRDFIKSSVAGLAALRAPGLPRRLAKSPGKSRVILVKTADRALGVRRAVELLGIPSPKGVKVLLKPNWNTADTPPGSTHNDTLAELVREMLKRGAAAVSVGERSGPPATSKVIDDKGIPALAKELAFDVIDFEALPDSDWVPVNPKGSHWPEGFAIPKVVADARYIVGTCCLKTHGYGGVFTMSLKLAVGLTPKKLMHQLHRSPDMRRQIAEINLAYRPVFILMDGVEAFVEGGPMVGKLVRADVVLAGSDRVALDAVGIAILKELGANKAIMERKIFAQEQIQRAVELGLGAAAPGQIEIVSADAASEAYAQKVRAILSQG